MKLISDLYFSDKGFVFDPNSGTTFSLNKAGSYIFTQLRKGMGVIDIAQNLVKEFDVEPRLAREDVRDFVQQLKDMGLLQEETADKGAAK